MIIVDSKLKVEQIPYTNKHYYCMFNSITVTTSDVIDEGYKEYICERFERPNKNNGFDFAEIIESFIAF